MFTKGNIVKNRLSDIQPVSLSNLDQLGFRESNFISEVAIMRSSLNSKKIPTIICAALVGTMLATSGSAFAQSNNQEVRIASSAGVYTDVSVTIDGTLQEFEQSAVMVDGSTLVPMRGIFSRLGAVLSWNADTQTVTAVKGDTEVSLTIGNTTAYIKGQAVTLSTAPVIVNDSTLIPLRFVAESLGAKVAWDGDTYTASIESPVVKAVDPAPVVSTATHKSVAGAGSRYVISGLNVFYGNHTYGSQNQQQYDKVMEAVTTALKGYENIDPYNNDSNMKTYADAFFAGKRWDGDRSNFSHENRGLNALENAFGTLVSNGVSKEEVLKVRKISAVASTLLKGMDDTQTGADMYSAFQAIFSLKGDCDSVAQVASVVFDQAGYNTAILGKVSHADMIVQIGNNWYMPKSGGFIKVDLPTSTNTHVTGSQEYLYQVPTFK